MFDIPWQDFVLSLGNLVFFIALLPSIFSKDKPAFLTSTMTAFFLTTFGIVYATLGLWFSVAGVFLSALGWTILAFQSYRLKQKVAAETT